MNKRLKNAGIPIAISFLFGILVLVVLLPASPIIQKIPADDSGMYLYTGREILSGKMLYRDVWDNKGPLLYYLNALGLYLGRDSRWGVWFLEFIFVFLAAIAGFKLSREVFGFLPAIFATVGWVMSLVFVLDGGNLTEEYALPLQFLSLYLFWRAEKRKLSFWPLFLIGILGGLAFLLRQNLIGVTISILFFLLIRGWQGKDFLKSVRKSGVVLLGFSLPIAVVYGYFAKNQALADLIEATFRFNLAYSASSLLDRFKAIFMGFWILTRSGIIFFGLVGWLIGLWYNFFSKRNLFESKDKQSLFLLYLIVFPSG